MIDLDKMQPKHYDPNNEAHRKHLERLKQDIQERGLIEPVSVTPYVQLNGTLLLGEKAIETGKFKFWMLNGEKRTLAYQELGRTEIEAIPKEVPDFQEIMAIQFVTCAKGISLSELNPISLSYAIRRFQDKYKPKRSSDPEDAINFLIMKTGYSRNFFDSRIEDTTTKEVFPEELEETIVEEQTEEEAEDKIKNKKFKNRKERKKEKEKIKKQIKQKVKQKVKKEFKPRKNTLKWAFKIIEKDIELNESRANIIPEINRAIKNPKYREAVFIEIAKRTENKDRSLSTLEFRKYKNPLEAIDNTNKPLKEKIEMVKVLARTGGAVWINGDLDKRPDIELRFREYETKALQWQNEARKWNLKGFSIEMMDIIASIFGNIIETFTNKEKIELGGTMNLSRTKLRLKRRRNTRKKNG